MDEALLCMRASREDGRSRLQPRFFLCLLFLLHWSALWPGFGQAQSAGDDRGFDIGIVIDNRPLPRSIAAREDVNNLLALIDSQMFIEHIMVFERPTIEVICDIFGCPEEIEPPSPFPSLLWQITRRETSRVFVYYIGNGRAEGLERQLLFSRQDGSVAGLSVDWLHRMLDEAEPASAVLMLDTSFAPRPLPCADDDPRLIDDALLDIRRNYLRIARDQWNRRDVIELSATTPVQPDHCDRFDLALGDLQQPLFTKFFLKGVVEGEADEVPFGDDDGLIEHGELADYLDDRISRAARFQWGRRQNVHAAGSRSRALASVDPGELTERTQDVIDRRNRAAAEIRRTPVRAIGGPPGSPSANPPIESPGDPGIAEGVPAVGEASQEQEPEINDEPRCGEDPTADDCHPCVLEPGGAACLEHCERDAGSNFCTRFLTTSTEPGADMADSGESGTGGIEVVPLVEENEEAPSAACDIAVAYVAPYAAALMGRIRGDVAPSCDWATDRSEVERGPFAQIFTPVAWRLGRTRAQDMVHCLLDCGGVAALEESVPTENAPSSAEIESAPPPRTEVDPRTLSAFNRHVCDRLHEPLPAYIGLPRWMPGTLMVSEALRAGYGCPPPAVEPALPVPLAVAIAPPPKPQDLISDDMRRSWAALQKSLADFPPYGVGFVFPSLEDRTPVSRSTSPNDEPIPRGGRAPGIVITDAGTPPGGGTFGPATPAVPPEPLFLKTEGKVHWLQMALTVDNRNPGPIDGIMGRRTRAAIQSWRRDKGRLGQAGPLTEPEFQDIIREFGERFEQVQARVGGF